MQAFQPSGSGAKATTTPRHLQVMAIVGCALVSFLITKNQDARAHLESVTIDAVQQGYISDQDANLVSDALAKHPRLSMN